MSAAEHLRAVWMSEAAAGIRLLKCFCRCFCWTFREKLEPRIPAGSAKKEMAKTEKQEAMVFPTHVWGTLSP